MSQQDGREVEAASSGMTPGQHRNLNTLYLILFMLAVVASIALTGRQGTSNTPGEQSAAAQPTRLGNSVTAADDELLEERFIEEYPWYVGARGAMLLAGIVLLILYVVRRLKGERPVRREEPNRVTWTFGALLKGFAIVFFVFTVLSIAASRLVHVISLPRPGFALIVDAAAKILAVIWILFMLRSEYGTKLSDMGIKLKLPFRDIGYGLLAYFALMPVLIAVALLWKWFGESIGYKYEDHLAISSILESNSTFLIVIVVLSAVVVAPVVEEFFFRGFIYPVFRKRTGILVATLVSSVGFALIHGFFSFLPIMVLAVVLAFLYERRQNIVAPVALHFINNAMAIGQALLMRSVNT
jgi:membrane protease YdiL (CAAX protease family)